tara:strand:- start:169 stop:1047 length:879 start_codon:yes stop_codon:yes gene_type:complete
MSRSGLAEKVVITGSIHKEVTTTKKDKESARHVDAAVGGNDSVNVSKKLIDRKSLAAITAIKSEWVKYKTDNLSTFNRAPRGCGILKVENLTEFENKFRNTRREWEREVNNFCNNYDEVIAESRRRQGSNFDAGDLPKNREDMRSRFVFEIVSPYALENPDDLAFALSESRIDEIKQEISDDIMNAIRKSLEESFESVIHMADSLSNYNPDGGVGEKKFYKGATIENVRKAADSLDNLNFTDDEGIKEIQKRMRKMIEGHTLESTKQNKASREALVADANDIIDKNFASFGF